MFTRPDGSYLIPDLGPGNYSVIARDVVGRYLENCAGPDGCASPEIYGIGSSVGANGVNVALTRA